MPAGFDRSQFNLHKCHVTNFHGLIFVCLSGDAPPDFTEEYAPFDEMLDFHGFGDAKIAVKRDYPNRCNRKLVVENFIECYHCAPSHPEYCSVHPQDQLLALGAGPGSGPDNLAWVWDATTRQDKRITEDNNAGILSSRYQPGPYSTQEAKVAAFIRWYLNSIR